MGTIDEEIFVYAGINLYAFSLRLLGGIQPHFGGISGFRDQNPSDEYAYRIPRSVGNLSTPR